MGFGPKETHPKYNDQVENGKPRGLCIMYFPNANLYLGKWKDGNPWKVTDYDKNGKI